MSDYEINVLFLVITGWAVGHFLILVGMFLFFLWKDRHDPRTRLPKYVFPSK